MVREVSDERVVARIEAFSDIVIGFSLAQLGVSLTFPNRPTLFFISPIALYQFLFAFTIVCSMWWNHRRFCARAFVPRPLPIVLNFVWLAIVVLLVFAGEAGFRGGGPAETAAWRLYFLCYALGYGLLGVQFVLGARGGAAATEREHREIMKTATFMFLWTAPFVICMLLEFVIPHSRWLGYAMGGAFSATIVASRTLRKTMGAREEARAAA